MPFGSIFGGIFFGGLCSWVGVGLLASPTWPAKAAGASLVALGISMALGLLRRQTWARWGGALLALVAMATAGPFLADSAEVASLLIPLAALVTAVLLAVPATGDPSRGSLPTRPARSARLLPGVAALSGLAFAGAVLVWAGASTSGGDTPPGNAAAPKRAAPLPQAAEATQINWTDFATGLDRARAEGKPLLVTFVTDWCAYCKKMDRATWRARAVVERMRDVIAVRIDAEESSARVGPSGEELARKYRVTGYPATVLLDANERTISRADGYLEPGRLLQWLDRSVPKSTATARPEAI